MHNTKDISELTEIEIKALLYDQIVMLQSIQNNITLLQAELAKRTIPKES